MPDGLYQDYDLLNSYIYCYLVDFFMSVNLVVTTHIIISFFVLFIYFFILFTLVLRNWPLGAQALH